MVTKTIDIAHMQAFKAYLLSVLEQDSEIILTEGNYSATLTPASVYRVCGTKQEPHPQPLPEYREGGKANS